MGNLKFGEQSTKDLGLVIQAPPVYEFPAKEVTITHIPGRNGDIVIDTDSFKNVTRTYSIASVFKPGTDFVANSEKIIKWLTSKEGYQRLEDSYDPEVYRLAVFKNNGSLQNYYDKATALNITFECKPQRYLKVGEKEVSEETSLLTIENPTAMTSLPKLKVEGISTGTENNRKVIMCSVEDKNQNVTSNVTLSDLSSTTVILDSEKQTAEDALGNNIAKSVGLNGSSFPKLKEGINKIKIDKYSEIPLQIGKYQTEIDNKKFALLAKYKPYEDLVESKQNKVTIKSYSRLIEDSQEQYDAEAYQNLALDNAAYYAYESFNKSLTENSTYLEFNTKNVNKLLLYYDDLDSHDEGYKWSPSDPSSSYEPFNDTIMITTRGDLNEGYHGKYDNESSYKYVYLIKNDFTKCVDSNDEYGCFIVVENLDDNSKSATSLVYVKAYSKSEIISRDGSDYMDMVKNNVTDSYSIVDRIGKLLYKDQTYRIRLYRAKWNNGSPEVYYDDSNEPNWFKTRIKYDRAENDNTVAKAAQVEYYMPYAGYVYKPKSSSNGIFSNLINMVSSIFNKTGWAHVSANSIVESIAWNEKKLSFVQESFLSSSEDYTIERYFILDGALPQYQDIVLQDTYEKDINGNVILDAAGNKVNKVIKSRVDIVSIEDDFKNVTKIKFKYDGYYKFNNDEWYYYTANSELLVGNSAYRRGYETKTTKSNAIYYLSSIPDYSTEKDYPSWLDIKPNLYNSDDGNPLDDNDIVSGGKSNVLNATEYDLVVNKKEWIWYNFIDNNISKVTEHVIRDQNEEIDRISPDSGLHHRLIDKDFTVYQLDLDEENPEVFPIHEYEFVETTDNSGKIYLPNVKDRTVFDFSIYKTYHEGDYCLYPARTEQNPNPIQHIYKCIVETSTEGEFIQEQWEIQNELVVLEAEEYDSSKSYELDSYCIYDRSLWKCTSAILTPEEFDETHWIKCGEYIKNIGFFNLNKVTGAEEEYKLNIPPEWLIVHIVRGSSDDYSDTVLKYKVLDASTDTNYYLWNENTAWIRWDKAEHSEDEPDVITTELYKSNASIYMMTELPEYPESIYYKTDVVESSTGNPESINVKAKLNAYYKVGNSSNYVYHSINDILDNIKIDQVLDMVYLEPDNDPITGVTISIIPRWWSL